MSDRAKIHPNRVTLIVSLLMLTTAGVGWAQNRDTTPAAPTRWSVSYSPGYYDAKNHFVGGTEIMTLTPFNGKLYAANAYPFDTPGPEGPQNSQVLVLNSPAGVWQQEVSFGGSYCNAFNSYDHTPQCNYQTEIVSPLTFVTDANGTTLNPAVTILTATTTSHPVSFAHVNVYSFSKNNTDGKWYQSLVHVSTGKIDTSIRSLATHIDPTAGPGGVPLAMAFGGADVPAGIFSATLSPTQATAGHNPLVWNTNVEFQITTYSGTCTVSRLRILSFAESLDSNGKLRLYAGVCDTIYVRTDGPQSTCTSTQVMVAGVCQLRWNVALPMTNGLRGLTQIGTHDILFCQSGQPSGIFKLDTSQAKLAAVRELNMTNRLAGDWGMTLERYPNRRNRLGTPERLSSD